MTNNNIVTRFEILHIIMILAEITKQRGYQLFLNSLLGISPEAIDKSILCERRKSQELQY